LKNFSQHEKAIVEPGAQVGDKTRIWAFSNIKDGARIGKSCNICDGCYVEKGAVIGDHVTLKQLKLPAGMKLVDEESDLIIALVEEAKQEAPEPAPEAPAAAPAAAPAPEKK